MATGIGAFSTPAAWWNYVTLTLKRGEEAAPWRQHYRMLEAYAMGNGVYEVINKMLETSGASAQDLRGLRNPAGRVCEFYSAKMFPGMLPDALPIETKNQRIVEPIHQLWLWSNWSVEKQTFARWAAMFGDSFIKVATNEKDGQPATRVFLQNIKPEFVTEMETDERGYLTFIRLDIPRTRRVNDKNESFTHTEVWEKESQTYRLWEHTKPIDTELSKLGAVKDRKPFAAFGIDFVPFVWMPFRAIGDERGVGAFTLQLEKIDEANRQATRLHQMMFRHNKPLWALSANAVDATNRPLPPPRIGSGTSDTETLEVGDDTLLKLPGMSKLESLIPQIDYTAALEVLNAQLREIKEDLPELAYYALREMGEPSGVAVRLLLSDALDRLLEARGNGETGLVRAQQMALTLGVNAGLFSGIGTFEAGEFEHRFADRDPFPLSTEEKGAIAKTYVEAGFPLLFAARKAGFDDEDIKQLEKDQAAEEERNATMADAALEAAEARLGQTGNGVEPSQNGRTPERVGA